MCALLVLAFCVFWFVGLDRGRPGTVGPGQPSRVFPEMWPPVARGLLWLFAGVAAVGFDLLVVRAGAETERGRDLAAAFALVTGLAFLGFAIASFTNAI
jgi:hypothetical protein